jgi:hypothetical protein
MPLPKASELDLPIRNPELSGPAIDWLQSRRETDGEIQEPPNFDEELDRNWLALRDRVTAGMKRFLAQAEAELADYLAASGKAASRSP